MSRRWPVYTLVSCLAVLRAPIACAQDFPARPLRVITAEAGGAADLTARLLAQQLSVSLGRPVVVENQASASGIVAAMTVVKTAPDGHTLLFYGMTIWIQPFLKDRVPYDPVRDFAPIALVDRQPTVLVVHPSLPVGSVKDLVALARARPGELNYAAGGTGSSTFLAGELFKSMARLRITRIPYKSTAPAMNALLGGQVQLMFPTIGSVAPHLKSGKVRALAVTGPQRSTLVPTLPTISASGLPGYEAEATHGLFAPAKTPAATVNRINHDLVQALSQIDVREKLANAGIEAVGSSPEQLAAAMQADMAKWGKLIKDVGIRED
jgi:tripartite-type tricarboxylate transporter receptor subunit TctC